MSTSALPLRCSPAPAAIYCCLSWMEWNGIDWGSTRRDGTGRNKRKSVGCRHGYNIGRLIYKHIHLSPCNVNNTKIGSKITEQCGPFTLWWQPFFFSSPFLGCGSLMRQICTTRPSEKGYPVWAMKGPVRNECGRPRRGQPGLVVCQVCSAPFGSWADR